MEKMVIPSLLMPLTAPEDDDNYDECHIKKQPSDQKLSNNLFLNGNDYDNHKSEANQQAYVQTIEHFEHKDYTTSDSEQFRWEHNDSPSTVLPNTFIAASAIASSSSTATTTKMDDYSYGYSSGKDVDDDDDVTIVTNNVKNDTFSSVNHSHPATSQDKLRCDTNVQENIITQPFFIFNELIDIDPTTLRLVQKELHLQKEQKAMHSKRNLPNLYNETNVVVAQPQSNDNHERSAISKAIAPTKTTIPKIGFTPSLSVPPSTDLLTPIPLELLPVNKLSSLLSCPDLTSVPSLLSSHFYQRSIQIMDHYNTKGINTATKLNNSNIESFCHWKLPLQYWLDAIEIWNQLDVRKFFTTRLTNSDDNDSVDHFKNDAIIDRYQMMHIPVMTIFVNMYNNLGVAYGKLQQYEKAIQSLYYALNVGIDLLSLDDHTNHNNSTSTGTGNERFSRNTTTRNIVTILHNIATVYQQQNHLSIAIQYYVQCKVLLEDMKQQQATTRNDNNRHSQQQVMSTENEEENDSNFTTSTSSVNLVIARTCIAIAKTYVMAHAYYDAYEAYDDAISILSLSSSCYRNTGRQMHCTSEKDDPSNNDINTANNTEDYELGCYRTLLYDLEQMKRKIELNKFNG